MESISVIMPLFNAEKYLPEALQSVLSQTYRDFELICINDCSTDNTVKILADFQRKDKRIKTIMNREHLGAGLSRNEGLKVSSGRYIIFLDGDDIFEEELFEEAYITMERYQTDIVIFEYAPHTPSEVLHIKRTMRRPKEFIDNYCKASFSMKDFEPREFPDWYNSPCNKMFRRKLIEENELRFQDLPSSNDIYFVKMAFFLARKMICLDDRRVMVYAREHFEPFRISNNRDPMCTYYAMEKLAIDLSKRNLFCGLATYYFYAFATIILGILLQEKDEERKMNFYHFLQNEGIPKCIQYGGEFYNNVDDYDKYILECIISNTYRSKWFLERKTYFQFYLERNGKTVLKFIKGNLIEGKKIVLWGVGRNGKSLLDYLDKYSLTISAITDMDKSKQGNIVNGYKIVEPHEILEMVDLIITTSKQVLWEINDRTNSLGIEQIDISELLRNRIDIRGAYYES